MNTGGYRHTGPFPSPLFTDLYELTMLQAYFDCGMENTATFEFSFAGSRSNATFCLQPDLRRCSTILMDCNSRRTTSPFS